MDAIQGANRIINLFDPPKDLLIGGHLSASTHGRQLSNYINQLFGMGEPFPDGWVSVGDKKEKILDRVGVFFGTSNAITRPKYSTGVDSRPTGLYVLQDNGPNNVIVNGTFLITPGSILDPSEKTKSGVNTFNTVSQIGGVANTLPMNYITSLSMQQAVTAPIRCTFSENKYKIQIPTQMGEIETTFNNKFKPQGNETAAYFLGNEVKNQYIASNINNQDEVKKYILIKELGDTLEVQWLNWIYDIPNVPVRRENTVVITTDNVVKFRAVVNSVGVIHTFKDKSFWILPGGEAAAAAANAAFIQTQIANLQKTNNAVIKLLENIRDSATLTNPRPFPWIDGIDWNQTQRRNAVEILNISIQKLKIYISDLIVNLRSLNDPQKVTEICSKSHFINPFALRNDGYFYRIKSVNQLVKSGIPFYNAQFRPTILSNLDDSYKKVLNESRGRQAGGVIPLALTAPAIAGATAAAAGILGASIWACKRTKGLHPFIVHALQATEIAGAYDFSIDEPQETFLDQSALFKMPSLGTNTKDGSLWYIYVREYHPEIFTYATLMKEAFRLHNSPIYTEKYSTWKYISLTFLQDYYKQESDYRWREDNAGIISNFYRLYISYINKTLLNTTKEAIKLARTFVTLWPNFQSQDLDFFFAYNQSSQLLAQGDYVEQANDIREVNFQEGGGEKQSSPAETALDLYEIHHSLLVQSNEDLSVPYEHLVQERLEFLPGYIEYLKENPDDMIMKRQFSFLLQELMSLEVVQNEMDTAKSLLENASPYFILDVLKNLNNIPELKNRLVKEILSISQKQNEKPANLERSAIVSVLGGAKRKTKKKSKSKMAKTVRKKKE